MEVLQRTANRGSISTGGYEIGNSLKLERANSEYLSRTPSSSGNQQIFTFSSWVKFSHINSGLSEWSTLFSAGDYAANSPTFRIGHHTNNSLQVSFYTNSEYTGYYRTDALHRDIAAWYHFVCAVDTTQGTNTNRVKIYVNGVLAPTTSVVSHVAQNYNSGVNTGISHRIGHGVNMQTYASEYLADTHFVDGQALAPTEFGEFDDDSGIWIPKEVDVTYGTNGFYLDFADSGDLGDDESGNGNDWTENNIAAADQSTDTPTNNFCTMNVLKGGIVLGGTTYNRIPLMTEGATVVGNNSTNYTFSEATMGVTSGKWYWEMKPTVDANTLVSGAGIATNTNLGFYSTDGVGNFFYHYSGSRYVNGAATGYGAAWTTNDIIGFAYDADNWTLTCYINNSSQGNLLESQADLSAEIAIPYMYSYGTHTYQWNFGGYHANSLSSAASDANGYGTFEYAPPSGYYALCTKNLAEFG
jgi:hypothetical protein